MVIYHFRSGDREGQVWLRHPDGLCTQLTGNALPEGVPVVQVHQNASRIESIFTFDAARRAAFDAAS